MATAMAGSKAGENIKSGIPTIDESLIENPIARFSKEEIEQIGKEFDALHDEVFDDLGERDAKYIRSIIELQRRMALIARILLVGSKYPPLWISGTTLLSAAKIIENMEIGHNVLH